MAFKSSPDTMILLQPHQEREGNLCRENHTADNITPSASFKAWEKTQTCMIQHGEALISCNKWFFSSENLFLHKHLMLSWKLCKITLQSRLHDTRQHAVKMLSFRFGNGKQLGTTNGRLGQYRRRESVSIGFKARPKPFPNMRTEPQCMWRHRVVS